MRSPAGRLWALAAPGLAMIGWFFTTIWVPGLWDHAPLWAMSLAVLLAVGAGIAANRLGEPEGLSMLVAAVDWAAAVLYGVPLVAYFAAYLYSST